ncbi:MAG: hypothetical protein AAGD05_01410, partial [Bacteroidota bacterium]
MKHTSTLGNALCPFDLTFFSSSIWILLFFLISWSTTTLQAEEHTDFTVPVERTNATLACPTFGNFPDPGDICEGETFDLTASGLTMMDVAANGETDFGISFVAFTGGLPAPVDPYTGGTVLASLLFGDLTGFDIARSGTASGLGGALTSGTYTICVILNPASTDINCQPSLCFELEVNALPTEMPTNPMDASYCGRERPPALSVDIPPAGNSISWWTAPTGGMQVTGATLSPSGNQIGLSVLSNPAPPAPGASLTLYAELSNTTTGCINPNRVAVTLSHFADPVVSFTALADLCLNDGVQSNLGGGSPTGGAYSGPGVTDNGNGTTYDFDPIAAGVGIHTITYDLTDGNGCMGTASDMVEVLAVPEMAVLANLEVCEGESTALLPTTISSGGSMTLFTEFFETDGNGTRYTTSTPEFSDGANDFFTRTDGSTVDANYQVVGQQGNFYFAAQDINGLGGSAQDTLTFSGINIAGQANLLLDILLAEDDATDGMEDWDNSTGDNNFVHIDFQIDGSGFQNLLHIEGDAPNANNGQARMDRDFDGLGDSTVLTEVFQNFNLAIAGTGTNLDLRIIINLEDGDEDIAIDNLVLTGLSVDGPMFKYYDADPAGGSANLLAGPTVLPFDPGTSATSSPQTVYISVCAMNGCESAAVPVVIEVNALPELMLVQTDVTGCPGAANGSIDVTAMGSVPLTYAWSTVGGSGLMPMMEDQTGLTAGTYTLTVTDADLCSATTELVLADAVDGLAPMITCPADLSLACGQSTLPATTGVATASDACSATTTLTYVDSLFLNACGGLTGSLQRTWIATDVSGNTASCVQMITITDTTNPTFDLPADLTIQCDDDPDDLGVTGNVSNVMDNCGPHPFQQIWVNELHYDNDGADTGEFIELAGTAGFDLTGYDLVLYAGTSGNPYQTIALTGMIPDETMGYGAVALMTPGLMNGSPDGFALVDPMGLVLVFASYEGSFLANSGPAQGLMATDIGVSEVGTTPIGQSLQLIGTGNALTDFVWSGPAVASPGTLNAGQNVQALTFANPTAMYNDVVVTDPNCPTAGTITRTWTVSDVCGNDSINTQTITVIDMGNPLITCPADLTVDCSADESPANTGMATATDNCDANPVVGFVDVETPGSCPQEKIITRTWRATDNCGNTAECTQVITVEDNTGPVPPTITTILNVQCANQIPDPVALTAIDDCSGAIVANPVDAISPGACPTRFTLLRTWNFTDECNNTTPLTQTINILDNDPLVVMSCAPDRTIECASDAIAQPYLMEVQTPCASDFTVSTQGPIISGTINCPGTTYTYTYVATDACGRTV